MVKIDFKSIKDRLIGAKVEKPRSGTLSGHAAGEPFDKFVYNELQNLYGKHKVFRQFEYLNDLYRKNPTIIDHKEKLKLIESPTAFFLLNRGESATKRWRDDNPFEEKQDDTADILISDKNDYQLIDIKTRNLSKDAQPPNIISSNKLAWVCKFIIDNKEYDNISIIYIGLDWELKGDYLVCNDAHLAEMFKITPSKLYINWAAAMQIQFHVSNVDQFYKGTIEDWAYSYLQYYVQDVYRRTTYMIEKYAKPFEKYLKEPFKK